MKQATATRMPQRGPNVARSRAPRECGALVGLEAAGERETEQEAREGNVIALPTDTENSCSMSRAPSRPHSTPVCSGTMGEQ